MWIFTINGACTCVYPHNYVTAGISAEELAKIPKAGIWKATLVLDVHRWLDGKVGVGTADITLNVTDHFAENAAIYFPQFGTATPRVDLNLHRLNASQMSGRANLDMCLYDGGVKARSLQMKIEGSNKSGTGFQVIKSDSADTIDYAVSMNYGDEVFLSPVAWSSVWRTWIKQQRVRWYFPGNGRRYVVCQCPLPDNTTL